MDPEYLQQLREENSISVILAAKFIPDGSTVVKKGGTKLHTLKREIKIFRYKEKLDQYSPQTIKTDGCVYIIPNEFSKSIEACDEDIELVWQTDFETLQDFLQARLNDDEMEDK